MDPLADLTFVADKIRQAVARIAALPPDRTTPGMVEKLQPLADQIQALASMFTPPEPAPLAKAPRPAVRAAAASPGDRLEKLLDQPGKVLQLICTENSPSNEEMHRLIDSLLRTTATPADGDRLPADLGSIGSEWSDSVATSEPPTAKGPAPASQPRSASSEPKKRAVDADAWDDLSRAEE